MAGRHHLLRAYLKSLHVSRRTDLEPDRVQAPRKSGAGDEFKREATAALEAFRARVDYLLASPWGRYAILTPTALSLVANFDDIGKIAKFIASFWKPLVVFVGSIVAYMFPSIQISHEILGFLVFILPLSFFGVTQLKANWLDVPKPLIAGVATISLCFIFTVLINDIHSNSLKYAHVGLLLTSIAVGVMVAIIYIAMSSLYFLISYEIYKIRKKVYERRLREWAANSRRRPANLRQYLFSYSTNNYLSFPELYDRTFIFLPISAFLVFNSYLIYAGVDGVLTRLCLAVICSTSLFSSMRIIQISILALITVSISLLHEGLLSAVRHLT